MLGCAFARRLLIQIRDRRREYCFHRAKVILDLHSWTISYGFLVVCLLLSLLFQIEMYFSLELQICTPKRRSFLVAQDNGVGFAISNADRA